MDVALIKCTKCGNDKPDYLFYKDSRKVSGLKSYCKECDKSYKRSLESIQRGRDRLRSANYKSPNKAVNDRNYRSTPLGKASKLRAKNKRRAIAGQHTLTSNEWEAVLSAFNYSCAYCGSLNDITLDHVKPVSKGGGTTVDNIIPACRSCNSRRRDKELKDFCSIAQYELITSKIINKHGNPKTT